MCDAKFAQMSGFGLPESGKLHQSNSGSVGNTLDVTAGKAYRFVYTVNGQGQGNLKIFDGIVLKAEVNYTGANKIDLGNSIRIQLRKSNGNGNGDMTITINQVNGQVINRTLSSNDSGNPPLDLTVSGGSLQTTLTVEGTAKLDFNGNGTASIKWEMAITAGNATCSTGAGSATSIGYIWSDHLNTPRAITNTANDVVWKWDSAPFGDTSAIDKPTVTLPAFTFNHRFPGQYYDKETGLHQNWHRDYDPSLGRYVQSDSIGLQGGTNTFLYVHANPLIYTDPHGLYWEYCQDTRAIYQVGADGTRTYFGSGNSGNNNPASQCVKDVGPIPASTYTISIVNTARWG
jgi:RHS repeat-associated protein